MALVQRDFILRTIEAIAAAVARALARRQRGDLPGARDEIAAATTELLGSVAPMARLVDVPTAVNLVSDPLRVSLWARLLAEDANVLRDMSRADEGDAADRRALSLLLELWHRGAELRDDDVALLRELAGRATPRALAEPYRFYLLALDR
jgi:hypothetical protein